MPSPLHSARSALERHRARHTPTGFSFAQADRIAQLNPEAWDAVTRSASVMMSRRYLGVVERSGPSNISPRYAMVYRGDEPLACVAAQSVRVVPGQIGRATSVTENGLARKRDRLAGMAKRAVAGIEQRMLVCGNLLSWGCHGIAVAPSASGAEVYAGVAEALYRLRRADKLAGETDLIVVKDFTPVEAPHAASLRTFSYRRLETEPNMVLELASGWKSFDDYLGALTSKYRGDAKRVRKDIEAAGMQVQNGPIADNDARTLHDLYAQVHAGARVRLFTLAPEFLPELSRTFAAEFRCTRLVKDGRVVGFVTTLKDGETAIGYYIGFDRAENAVAPVYFRLLQATVEDALAMRCRRVSLGRTALEPKSRMGAKPVPMEVWVRHRVPAMNLLVRAALESAHHDEAPERSVMKAAAE